jgi:PAP2 superfamily
MHALRVHGARTRADRTGRWHRRRLTWRRLPLLLELVTLAAAYGAPSLVRVVLTTTKSTAFSHALELYRVETNLRLNVEPWLNHLVAPHDLAAVAVGYYYGLLHFVLTPLTLAWLYWCRPRTFARLRSALVLSTIGANVVFWTWPVAPPRFAIAGLTDVLTTHNILDSADPHGVTGAANLYAALPSLHVCWATWCAVAVVTATRSRWRYLAWLYPAATTFVVLASANHFVLDVAGGVAVTALGLAASWFPLNRARRPVPVPAPIAVRVPAVAGLGRVTAILTSVGAAVLDGTSVSAAAFGALVGAPTPITAAVQARPRPGPGPEAGRRADEVNRARGVTRAGSGRSPAPRPPCRRSATGTGRRVRRRD